MNKMTDVMKMINEFKSAHCSCGRVHRTTIEDIQIGSGLVNKVGEILHKNDFPENILLVCDKNTLSAAKGIEQSLCDFKLRYRIYDNLRVAAMAEVEEIESLIDGKDIAILSVGTGSINDPCRLAAANKNKKLCIFATAPSMDGFASYSSPIVKNGFKSSYPAKSPEVIIGDTKILAAAPSELKSAGFGDMVAKYVALIDWQTAALLIDEYYCEKIAALTRSAVDELMSMADRVDSNDEAVAGKIFEALIKTGVAMSFTQNSRPASGCEHIISHLIECIELRDNKIPNYHGEDIGVCTLEVLKYYNELAEHKSIETKKENVDWDDVYKFYGNMADEVRKLNTPDTISDYVSPKLLKEKWQDIIKIIHSVPSHNECRDAMIKAKCKLTTADIGKDGDFFRTCTEYSPYMRRRLTLLRIKNMIHLK